MFGRSTPRREHGASLISVLVGLVIGLLVALTAMGSLTMFSAAQRQSIGVSSTLGAGLNALAAFKFELAQAGRGFMVEGAPVCERYNIGVGNQRLVNGQALLPVEISHDDHGALVLDVRYASALEASTPVSTRSAMNSATDRVELNSMLPVAAGQAVLIAPPAGEPSSLCTVLSVTGTIPANEAGGQQLVFATTGAHNKAFAAPDYPIGSRVFLMGSVVHTRFTTSQGQLVMARPLEGTETVLAEGVRLFDVEMGVTDAVSETLSAWTRAAASGPGGADWSTLNAARLGQVRALRVGLMLQSPQAEKPDVQGNCQATTQAPVLLGQSLTLSGNDACFRYRSVTTVVPLRNLKPVPVAV